MMMVAPMPPRIMPTTLDQVTFSLIKIAEMIRIRIGKAIKKIKNYIPKNSKI